MNRTDFERIELLSLMAWPAFETVDYDGWVLRAARGVSKRSNSVNPMKPSTMPFDKKHAYCAAWFAERDLRLLYRVTALVEPGLEDWVLSQGFERRDRTMVMSRSIEDVADTESRVVLYRTPSERWLDLLLPEGTDAPGRYAVRSLATKWGRLSRFAEIDIDGELAAIGQGSVVDDHVFIFNMNTRLQHRRQGLASEVLAALWGWARGLRATQSVLQVTEANDAGRAFYRGAGYEDMAPYWYLQPVGATRT